MSRIRKRIALAAGSTAVLAGVLIAPASAATPDGKTGTAGAAATCEPWANAPFYSQPTVYATGGLACNRTVADLHVDVTLTRDGARAGSTNNYALAANDIDDTATATNRAGNQKWCTTVQGKHRAPGSTHYVYYGPVTTCENRGF